VTFGGLYKSEKFLCGVVTHHDNRSELQHPCSTTVGDKSVICDPCGANAARQVKLPVGMRDYSMQYHRVSVTDIWGRGFA